MGEGRGPGQDPLHPWVAGDGVAGVRYRDGLLGGENLPHDLLPPDPREPRDKDGDHVPADLAVGDNVDPRGELVGDSGLHRRLQGVEEGPEGGALRHGVAANDRGREDLVDEDHGTSRWRSRGKITASLMFGSPSMVMTRRSAPRPQPAWGGIPYRKGRR